MSLTAAQCYRLIHFVTLFILGWKVNYLHRGKENILFLELVPFPTTNTTFFNRSSLIK